MKKYILPIIISFLVPVLLYSYSTKDIFYSVYTGQYDSFQKMKKDIYNISEKDKFGRNLLAACAAGMVDFRIKNSGTTALHVAAANNDIESIKMLLKNGADPNITDSKGQTPYVIAMRNHYHESGDLLQKGIKSFNSKEDKNGPSYYVYENYVPIMKELISLGVDVNEADNSGLTPLHYAVVSGYLPAVELLVSNGALVNKIIVNDGRSPLILAVEKGYIHIADYLLGNKAEVNIAFNTQKNVSTNGTINSSDSNDTNQYFAKPDKYNFKLVIYSDSKLTPDEDTRCYYKVFVDKVETGRTQIGLESQKKIFTAKLDSNRHLISIEKYELDESKNMYVKVNNIYQPKPSYIYVDIDSDKIMKLEIIHKPRNTDSIYNKRFLLDGEK